MSKLVFGTWLKETRKQTKNSQTAIAKTLDMSQPHVSMLETGKLAPTQEMLDALNKLFNTTFKTDDFEVTGKKYAPTTKTMAEPLIAAKESGTEELGLSIPLDDGVTLSSDKYQYILKIGQYRTYYSDINCLLKAFSKYKVRQSACKSLEEVIVKLDEIEKKIDAALINIVKVMPLNSSEETADEGEKVVDESE